MPTFEIICLANSKKRGGRCVAGLRTDGKGWLRPIGWNDEGILYKKDFTFASGEEIAPLNVARIGCAWAKSKPHHPEDWLITRQPWELAARSLSHQQRDWLLTQVETAPLLLGSPSDRIPYTAFLNAPATRSLALVAPDRETTLWEIRRSNNGERRLRVTFTLAGTRYNLAITDLAWEQRLLSLPVGVHSWQAVGLRPDETLLLTVSLSEPFQRDDDAERCCYKLVAAVLALPAIVETPVGTEIFASFLAGSANEEQTKTESVEYASLTEAYEDPFPTPGEATRETLLPVAMQDAAKPSRRLPEYIVKARQKFTRAFEKWSAAEDAALIELFQRGATLKEISAALQRYHGAIRSRLKKLGLTEARALTSDRKQEEASLQHTEVSELPETLRVAVSGAVGRMGREVVRAVIEAEGLELVAAIDSNAQLTGADAGELAGVSRAGVAIQVALEAALIATKPHVLVDFTLPDGVMINLRTALRAGVAPVVGTTGLNSHDLEEIDALARERNLGAFVAPNFAIGAVLMMQFAAQAAKYLPDVEIIELHHDKKLDSPSGTALLTAQRIGEARREANIFPQPIPAGLVEKAPGARGARNEITGDVPIHSVRLPGFVAHQEVIFGGVGQTLTLRHDSLDRRSFMPGVILAVRKVIGLQGLVVGLENLL